MDNELKAAALAYAAQGWQVFPCRPGLKEPQTQHGVKDATDDAKTIEVWWDRWPTANIGMACGEGSGVAVVDVDVDLEKGVDGWGTLEEMTKEGHRLPATVRSNSPRGGAHFFYSGLEGWPANKNDFRNGIDIRSAGYYVILPPSIHPNGKQYAWHEGAKPGEVALGLFPDFMRPELKKEQETLAWEDAAPAATPVLDATQPITADKKPQDRTEGTPIIERASLYLQEVDPAVEGHGGHDALFWAARAMVTGFELSEVDAARLLWSEFNPRCCPPWDSANEKSRKDFNRKIREAAKSPGNKPRGWLLDEMGLRDGGSQLDSFGEDIRLALIAQHAEAVAAHEKAAEVTPPPEEPPEDGDYPEWLLNPPGMVGEVCDWINATAGCRQPVLTLGAALVMCGSVFGRKVRDISDGRTNIYGMGVAHSSAGKDHASDCVSKLLEKAGGEMLIGGNNVTSDAALEVSLSVNGGCVQLFLWDEIGHMMANISGVAGTNPHLASIVPTLMKLYSSPHKVYVGKQYADAEKPLRRIDQPHACVWGYTSPDILYKGITVSELRDGWLGRIMTFISHDRPRYKMQPKIAPPAHLIEKTKAWLTRPLPPAEGGNITQGATTEPILVPNTKEATAVFDDFGTECHDRMIRAARLSDDCQFLWGKSLQNARRIALIVAAGDRFDHPEITEFHAKYGCALARACVASFSKEIVAHITDGIHDKIKKDMVEKIRVRGSAGMSKSDLTRATQGIPNRRVRDDYIADLVEAKVLVEGRHPEHIKARSWLWVYPHGLDLVEKANQMLNEGVAV